MRVRDAKEAVERLKATVWLCSESQGTYPCVVDDSVEAEVVPRPDIGPAVYEIVVHYVVDTGRGYEEKAAIYWSGPECPACGGKGLKPREFAGIGMINAGCPECGARGVVRGG